MLSNCNNFYKYSCLLLTCLLFSIISCECGPTPNLRIIPIPSVSSLSPIEDTPTLEINPDKSQIIGEEREVSFILTNPTDQVANLANYELEIHIQQNNPPIYIDYLDAANSTQTIKATNKKLLIDFSTRKNLSKGQSLPLLFTLQISNNKDSKGLIQAILHYKGMNDKAPTKSKPVIWDIEKIKPTSVPNIDQMIRLAQMNNKLLLAKCLTDIKNGAQENAINIYTRREFIDGEFIENDKTPFHEAVELGDTEIIHLLLNKQNSPAINIEDKNGNAPLHIATSSAIADILLNAKANPNKTNNNKETPLHIAVGRGDEAMVKLLKEKGAKPDARDHANNTPLSLATGNIKAILEARS